MSNQEVLDTIYRLYPRRVGKIDALKAIDKAINRLRKEENLDHLQAARKLFRATRDYAKSEVVQATEKDISPLSRELVQFRPVHGRSSGVELEAG